MTDEVYQKGQVLGRGDLGITMLEGPSGSPKDLGVVTYAVYFLDEPGHSAILLGPPGRLAASPDTGEYYANMRIPEEAKEGRYRVVWYWEEEEDNEPNPKIITGFRIEG